MASIGKPNSKGDMFWRENGEYHREDGPAIEFTDGSKRWMIRGKLHRIEGPAWIDINHYTNTKTEQWWYQGELIDGCRSQEEFERYIKAICLK